MKGRPPRTSDGVKAAYQEQLVPVTANQTKTQAPFFIGSSNIQLHSPAPEPEINFSDWLREPHEDDKDNTAINFQKPSPALIFGTERDTIGIHAQGGIENFSEVSRICDRVLEQDRTDFPRQYHTHRPLACATPKGSSPPMPITNERGPYYGSAQNNSSSVPPQHLTRGPSPYKSYAHRFSDSQSASLFRKNAMREGRLPYRLPDQDITINEVERDRDYHIERIYNAMTCGDKARDNPTSPAMKRWVNMPYYEAHLVESIAHKVLDCLLLQVRYGYRGWKHTDYVADDRKGEDEDRDVSCAGRLNNIIRALEEEKTICEDVMQSACQIRMFVNAPRAYANRKHQNRLGNRKRGQVKDFEEISRPTKSRRNNPRPRRGASSSLVPTIGLQQRSQTPEPPKHHIQQRFETPPARAKASAAMNRMPMPRMTPAMGHAAPANAPAAQTPSLGPHQSSPMFPQVPHASYIARMVSIPLVHDSPFLSPPSLTMGPHSAPTSPDDMQVNSPGQTWPSMQMTNPYGHSGSTIDPTLYDEKYPSWNDSDHIYAGASSNLFDQHPDITLFDASKPDNLNVGPSFEEYWASQSNVQNFPNLSRGQ